MKATALLAAVAATTLSISAVYAETTLNVLYAWPSHARFHEPVAEAFMQQNPDIKIKFAAPAESYDQAVLTLIRQSFANQTPDVSFVGYNVMRQLVNRNLYVDLAPFMAKEDMAALGYQDSVLGLGQIDGKQVGIPLTMSTPIVFYNADLVAKAGGDPDKLPTNWPDTIALAGKIAALGDGIDGMYYELGEDDWTTQALIMSFGGTLMNVEGTDVTFNGPEGKQALELFKRFHDEGGQPPIDYRSARQEFVSGQLGMYFASPAQIKTFEDQIGTTFKLGTAPLPLGDEAKATMPTGGMAAFILTNDAEKQAAAWKYIMFASGPAGQDIIVRNTGYMPTNDLALGKDYLGSFYEDHPQWATAATQVPRARPNFSWPGENGVQISKVLRDNMEAIAQGQKTPDQALADMESGVKNLLP
jgi:multiple sugar transport system substrate-binding protein